MGADIDVIIVDDEPAARRTLRECCERQPDFNIVGEYGDGRKALDAIRAQPPHLLFLDIQIESVNGISLTRALDPATLPFIVFVTAYDQYALEAFEVSATDYLLKPFDEYRFQETVERVRRRRLDSHPQQRQSALNSLLAQLERNVQALSPRTTRVLAESGSTTHMLDAASIELVEGDRNYVKFTVGRDVFTARSTLQQAEVLLQAQPMLRISRSFLVNVDQIRELSRTPRGDVIFVMAGGVTVTGSEGYRDSVKDYLRRLKIGSI